MAKILHFHNLLEKEDHTGYYTELNTFGEWVAGRDILTARPTVVILNGEELLEKDFDTHLNDDDVVCLMAMPEGDPASWAAFFAEVVEFFEVYGAYIALAAALLLPMMMEPSLPVGTDPEDGSSNYSVRQNRARIGKSIPCLFGTLRTYPDLSARNYSEFRNHDQYVYQLFEISQGYCEVDEASAQWEDTLLSNFQDYNIETIHPGETSTLFPTQVIVSTEVTNLEVKGNGAVFGTNGNDDLGPYSVNEAATQINYIAWDIAAPRGIYGLGAKHGSFRSYIVWIELWAREIDDAGVAVGAWVNYGSHSMTSSREKEPLNRTYRKAVPLGRYEAMVHRTTPSIDLSRYFDDLAWVGLKGYLPSAEVTDTTRVAVRVRASQQLGNYVLSKFNVKATRHLRSWTTAGGWQPLAATNSPAWAFAEACTSIYGGERQDGYVDLPKLEALAVTFADAGLECNGIFDTKTDLWSALQNIAQTGFCNRIDRAGVYTLVEDSAQVPTAMFGHRNIVRDSLSISHTGVVVESADSVTIEFLDAAQNYRPTTQLCIFNGGTSNNPRLVKLWGVTDQVQAHKIGMWLLAQSTYRRQTITFETGIEGKLPFFGDQIVVQHYLIGQAENEVAVSGEVKAWSVGDILDLSEDVSAVSGSPYIVLRNKDGSPSSPLQITVLSPFQIRIDEAFDETMLSFDADYELTHFTVGTGTDYNSLVKVVSIESTGKNRIKITGFVDDPLVYDAANGLSVPGLPDLVPPIDLAPAVTKLVAAASGIVEDTVITLSWSGTNSDKYDVEYSLDNSTWREADGGYTLTTGFEHHLDTPPSRVYYRVAGVSLGRGQWATVDVVTTLADMLPPDVTGLGLTEAFTGKSFTAAWDDEAGTNWRVDILVSSVIIYSEDVSNPIISLHSDVLVPLGSTRSFDVRVTPINYEELEGTPATLSISNPQSAAIADITTNGHAGIIGIDWTPPTESDHKAIAIWMSTTASFTPNASNLQTADAGNQSYAVALNDTAPRYFRIGAYDVWGSDGVNVSAEFSSSTVAGASFKSSSGYLYYQTRQLTAPALPTVGSLFGTDPFDFDTGVMTTIGSSWEATPLTIDESQANYYYVTWFVSKNGADDQVVELGSSVLLGTQFQNLVTFASLSEPGLTQIDGSLIKTGTIVADSIDTKNLTIKDGAGQVIFGVDDDLDFSRILNGPPADATNGATGPQIADITTAGTTANWTTVASKPAFAPSNATYGATWSQVSSKPAFAPSDADKTSSNTAAGISGQGSLATLSVINDTHISVTNLAAINATLGNVTAGTITGSSFETANGTTSRVYISQDAYWPKVTLYYGSSTKLAEMGGNSEGNVSGYAYSNLYGVYGKGNASVSGVYGINTLSDYGVEGYTSGSGLAAVKGYSTSSNGVAGVTTVANQGSVTGFHSGSGYGVYGGASSASSSFGVYGQQYSTSNSSAAGYFDGASCDIKLASGTWAAYTYGSVSTGAGTAGYGPFTGGHDALLSPSQSALAQLGDIVVDRAVIAKSSVSDAITRVRLSSSPMEKAAVGVVATFGIPLSESYMPAAMIDGIDIVGEGESSRKVKRAAKYEEMKDTIHHLVMNSLGEGQVSVCNEGGDIEIGDLITTSSMRGKGMLQADDLVHNYTVAKSREAVTFKNKNEVKMIACIYLCG